MLLAGPTTVFPTQREKSIKPLKFQDEVLDLKCEWESCNVETRDLQQFMSHVSQHIPSLEMQFETVQNGAAAQGSDEKSYSVFLKCEWNECPYRAMLAEDLQRHLYLHGYHTKLKCIGANTLSRNNLASCKADSASRNLLPDLSDNVVCAWGDCSHKFINIQEYYDHIREHCMKNPKGKLVEGGIQCCWSGCQNSFPNITKLRDHMRSHTQEKLLACPTCGGLFSNRTRFFDHCQRQKEDEEYKFVCSVCMKAFPTVRLLRDHIRSHVNTYRCTLCDMSCASPSALQNHVKYRHSTSKPFQCGEPECDYSAKTLNDLQRHERVHQNAVYQCDEYGCTYKSKSLSAFNFHWSQKHGPSKEPRYVCHVCEKKFQRGYYLTKHLVGTHKLQWPSGHSRFRYKLCPDGLFRLQTLRYETEEDGDEEEDVCDPLDAGPAIPTPSGSSAMES